MPKLRVGHDYHLAEAHKHARGGWFAMCAACGWVGSNRESKQDAEQDAHVHDVTENER